VWAGPNTLANPTTSTINFLRGDVKANNLTVGLRSTGSVSLMYLSSPGRTTDLVLDVTGYFVP
jgi:hypothetical protein